jgi:hypothetical protein
MKKIITIALFISTFLIGCSSDSSSSSSVEYMRININGTEYYEEIVGYYGVENRPNCSNNGLFTAMALDQVETSNFFVEVDLTHFTNVINFDDNQLNIISNTRLRDKNSVWPGSGGLSNTCDLNNDLTIVFEKNPSNERLYLKQNSTPTHNITNVSLVYEDVEAKTYRIKGNFNAIFNNGGVDLPIFGDYCIIVDVLQ